MTRQNSSPSAFLNAWVDPTTKVEEKTPVFGEKTALNVADIYRPVGWSGSDMWPRLPGRLNALFLVQSASFLRKSYHGCEGVHLARVRIAFVSSEFLRANRSQKNLHFSYACPTFVNFIPNNCFSIRVQCLFS